MEKPYVIGVDIGGQSTKFGIVDQKGTIILQDKLVTVCAESKPLPQYVDETKDDTEGRLKYLSDLSEAIQKIVTESKIDIQEIEGVGMGAPNANIYSGCIEFPPNLPWPGKTPVVKVLEESLKLPVIITNDANAAAYGEERYGGASGVNDFIMITLGTGVGSGVFVNGEVVYGHDGFAGELGHIKVPYLNGRKCGCGKEDCLETYASATGVARTAREMLQARDQDSLLRSLKLEEITALDVCNMANKGDVLSKEVFEFTGKVLGESLAGFVAFSSPQAIFLFGGLVDAGDLILGPIERHLNENLLTAFKHEDKDDLVDRVEIKVSSLPGANAAILGAASLARNIVERKKKYQK